MALFFGKKKKTAPAAPRQPKPTLKLIWSKEFAQSPSFRGFRRVKLSRYRHEAIDETIDTLKRAKYDLKGKTVRLDLLQSVEQFNEFREVRVYIDDMLIGSVFESDAKHFPMLTEYDYDKVHVRIEDSAPDEFFENVVTAKAFLFVHYPGNDPVTADVTVK